MLTACLFALLLALSTPAAAAACGLPLQARIPAEQALISYANGREEIITSVQIASAAPGAAVIFPVPGVPEVSVIEGNELFSYLALATRPPAPRGPVGGADEAGGVQLLGREQIGGYDVARLSADDPGALERWLNENGYRAPAGAAPILQAYIAEGWKFVAVKLATDQPANGALRPLRLAFDSPEIVYPMRLAALADAPLDVLLYVVADQQVTIGGLATEYHGPVAQLRPPAPPAVAALLRAPYLTRLRGRQLAPARMLNDFVARPASRPLSALGVVLGVALAVLASSAALGFALGLRRRINAIAGPDPDDDSDL